MTSVCRRKITNLSNKIAVLTTQKDAIIHENIGNVTYTYVDGLSEEELASLIDKAENKQTVFDCLRNIERLNRELAVQRARL